MPSSALTVAARRAAVRARRRAEGRCTECERPRLWNYSLCQRHFGMQALRRQQYRARREAAGRCDCGAPRAPRRRRCRACLAVECAKQQLRIQARRRRRLCEQCGQPLGAGKFVRCARCRERNAARYAGRRAANIRRRLRMLLAAGRISLPPHLAARGRWLIGRLTAIEAAPAQAMPAACRQYAAAQPGFEGFVLVSRRIQPRRPGEAQRTRQQVYLVTRSGPLVTVCHIPTQKRLPQEVYA